MVSLNVLINNNKCIYSFTELELIYVNTYMIGNRNLVLRI